MTLAYPTVKQFTGVAKEVTPGMPVAMTATLLTDSAKPDDKYQFLDAQAYRGLMGNDSFNVIEGVRYADVSLGGYVNADTIGYLLGNILGDVTDTGSSAPFTHKIALLNSGTGQPTTHTLEHYDGVPASFGARVYAGMCLSQLQFKFNAASGLFAWTAKANAWASQVAAATPTAAPSTLKPVAGWVAKMGLGGTVMGSPVPTVAEGTITINREIENEFTATGIQDPYVIFRGGASATFDLTFIAADESSYLHMVNNDQPQLQLLLSNGLSGAALGSVQFDAQQAAFTKATRDYGSKAIKFSTSGKFVFNTTNVGTSGGQSPLAVTLQNAITSGTYV